MATKLENITTKLQSALDKANALPDVVTLDTLSNPGSAATMLSGTEMLDSDGKKVTGTIETKTSDDLTANGSSVKVPAGYYASAASKSVNTTTITAPIIELNDGLISSYVLQSDAGYVSPGESDVSTLQLTTQAAKTIMPSTSSQTAVAKGVYTTGAVTVAGDANLTAENIADGVSIFGVTGTHSGGGGGADTSDATATADDIVEGETAYVNGTKITGTNPYEKATTDATVDNQADLLSQIITALQDKATAGGAHTVYVGTTEPTTDIGSDGDIYIMREASA